MKVTVHTDTLLERKFPVEVMDVMLESLENYDVDVRMVTYAHAPGKILGPIEQKNIESSFLSKLSPNLKKWRQWNFLAKEASSRFMQFLPDFYLTLSSGLSQGMKRNPKVRHFCYLLSFDEVLENQSLPRGQARTQPTFWERFFHAYLLKWKLKTLKDLGPQDILFVSSKFLLDVLRKAGFEGKAQVLIPPVVLRDVHIDQEALNKVSDYWVVGAAGLTPEVLKSLTHVAQLDPTNPIHFKIVGDDTVGIPMSPHWEVWGGRCGGELCTLLQNAMGYLDFSYQCDLVTALSALACGRPVGLMDHNYHREFFNAETAYFFQKASAPEVVKFQENLEGYFPKVLRAHALQFHDTKFKLVLQSWVEGKGPSPVLRPLAEI